MRSKWKLRISTDGSQKREAIAAHRTARGAEGQQPEAGLAREDREDRASGARLARRGAARLRIVAHDQAEDRREDDAGEADDDRTPSRQSTAAAI